MPSSIQQKVGLSNQKEHTVKLMQHRMESEIIHVSDNYSLGCLPLFVQSDKAIHSNR